MYCREIVIWYCRQRYFRMSNFLIFDVVSCYWILMGYI